VRVLVCVALCACGNRPASRELANTAPPQPTPRGDPLALAKGATFRYEVSFDAGAGVHRFPWTMTVVDVVEASGVTLYKISGWPEQLADLDVDPAKPPSPKLRNLINAYDNFVWGDSIADVAGTRWFTWPLFDGQRICPEPKVRYCWMVSVERGRYRLRMVTNPDDQTFELTPGVGLTHYEYHHHGSPLSVEANLVR
jgi:hypothetical protein